MVAPVRGLPGAARASLDSLSSASASPSLGALLDEVERGRAREDQLMQLCLRPASLAGVSARDAQRAVELFANGSTDGRRERAIVNVLGALSPEERGECLRLLDGGADRHTADRLVTKDIDDPRLRREAVRLLGEARPHIGARPGHVVVSDIDDTIKPRKGPSRDPNVFPGARELFSAIDAGPDGTDSRGDIHFVTARDGFFLSGAPAVKAAGFKGASVRHGDALSAIVSPFDDNRALADRKVKNIGDVLARNPSRKVILVGDTVQADPDVFRRVMDARPHNVEVALVHEIRGFRAPDFVRNDPRFVVFRDYGEAARALAERGLISPAQRDHVVAAAG
jgi:hypothetical protein